MSGSTMCGTVARPALAVLVGALALAGACRDGDAGSAGRGAEGGRRFTLAVAGDVLVHEPVALAAAAAAGDGSGAGGERVTGHDFAALLADVEPVVGVAGLAVCHLETPLARPGGAARYGPWFAAPAALAAGLASTGFDACSTASNHALDAGPAGVAATLDALDNAGLGHAGTARDAAEAARPAVFDAGGVTVGLVSFTAHFNEGTGPPPGMGWLAAGLEEAAVLDAAGRAREAGAEFVVVAAHWGTEYRAEPDDLQRRLAPRLLASPDVDLVVGHGAHVVQPAEHLGGEYVLYGLGNLLAGQADRCCPSPQDGVVVVVEVEEDEGRFRATGIEAFPTVVEPDTFRVRRIDAALAEPGLTFNRREDLSRSWCETTASLRRFGAEVTAAGTARRCSS